MSEQVNVNGKPCILIKSYSECNLKFKIPFSLTKTKSISEIKNYTINLIEKLKVKQ